MEVLPAPDAELLARGVCVQRAACERRVCEACLAEVRRGLDRMEALPGPPAFGGRHFMKVSTGKTSVPEPTHRSSFALPFSPAVEAVFRACLSGAVGAILVATLGRDATLREFTAITAMPSASAQEMHSDGMWSATGPRVVTVFLALHDIVEEAMAPTRFCPETHVPRCFPGERWLPPSDPQAEAPQPVWFALHAGDAVLMEQTCWHCGGANTSDAQRTLLSFTFVAAAGGAEPQRQRKTGAHRAPRLGDFIV